MSYGKSSREIYRQRNFTLRAQVIIATYSRFLFQQLRYSVKFCRFSFFHFCRISIVYSTQKSNPETRFKVLTSIALKEEGGICRHGSKGQLISFSLLPYKTLYYWTPLGISSHSSCLGQSFMWKQLCSA